uniref:Uncharacterized protein n=1 Tax=Spongospora subterranea TaxID=70186 RepID=A0A0H5RD32_9EUKA|eukprot:CRZ11661.1 hypothetical protein [Spongospora subterranea]
MNNIHICSGSYDRAITGFVFDIANTIEDDIALESTPEMTRRYATVAHTGPIRCVASHNNILASSGDDEIIRVYDVMKMVELGSLMLQQASISHIEFGSGKMMSAADDGSICIWLVKDWSCDGQIKAHKGKITGLSVHPSGRLALSVGQDRVMALWDLSTYKSLFTIKTKTNTTLVRWSQDGAYYALVCDKEVRVFNSDGGLVSVLPHPARVLSIVFHKVDMIATGCDDGVIRTWTVEGECGRLVHELVQDVRRVSCLALVPSPPDRVLIASGSSDGQVSIWDLSTTPSPTRIATADAKLRITSICSINPDHHPTKSVQKPKRESRAKVAAEPSTQLARNHTKPPAAAKKQTAPIISTRPTAQIKKKLRERRKSLMKKTSLKKN